MSLVILLLLSGIIIFLIIVMVKRNEYNSEVSPPPKHNIPEKFFETVYYEKDYTYSEKKNKKSPRKKAVPKKKVSLQDGFQMSETNLPIYGIINFETETKPSSYYNSYLDFHLWPDITKLGYYVFDEKYKLVYSKIFDFKKSGIEQSHKYDEFLKDMRSVKILVSHNIDYKIKALKADFLKNGYKLSLFKRQRICLMENTTPIVGIDTGHSEFKWPSFSEMITALFYPDESIEDYEPEEMGDFEWDTKALAKTFIKLS